MPSVDGGSEDQDLVDAGNDEDMTLDCEEDISPTNSNACGEADPMFSNSFSSANSSSHLNSTGAEDSKMDMFYVCEGNKDTGHEVDWTKCTDSCGEADPMFSNSSSSANSSSYLTSTGAEDSKMDMFYVCEGDKDTGHEVDWTKCTDSCGEADPMFSNSSSSANSSSYLTSTGAEDSEMDMFYVCEGDKDTGHEVSWTRCVGKCNIII